MNQFPDLPRFTSRSVGQIARTCRIIPAAANS